MADDMGERTEAPTSRRLQESRDRGNVAKSTDLSAAIELSAAVILLAIFGASLVESLGGVMRRVFEDGWQAGGPDVRNLGALLVMICWQAAIAALPIMCLMVLFAWLAQVCQFGWIFTLHPLQPKLDRLDPIKGVGRLFATRNMMKTLVNFVKLTAVGVVSWLVLRGEVHRLALLPTLSFMGVVKAIIELLVQLAIWLLVILLVIGIIDFMYQRWQHTKDMRMTKQQVQDERRAMEGDPQIKGRRMRMAREIAMQRIGRSVPEATVVVTNPTHFSVAIRYDADTMRAPRVVAKGVDFMAMRIRQVAGLHDVPIVERPPLARGLYYGVDEGREIPAEFYQAVAEVLAHVYRLEDEERRAQDQKNATVQSTQEQAIPA